MFGRRKLLKNGVDAQAVVMSSWIDDHPPEPGAASARYPVQLRVTFPDGSTEDLASHIGGLLGSWPVHAGDIVPVRYDPADHSRIEVDEAALQVAHDARTAAVRADQVSTAEAELRKAALRQEIAARAAPPSDAELEDAAAWAATARARARASLERSPLGDAPSEAASARHRDVLDYDLVKTEFRALWALRPDWAPALGDPTAPR